MQNSSGQTNYRSINYVCSLLLNTNLVSLAASAKRKESGSQNRNVVPTVCLVWGGHYLWLVWMGWVTLPTSDLPVIYLQGPMSLGHFSLSHSTLMFSNSTVIIPYSSLGAMTPQWVYRLTPGIGRGSRSAQEGTHPFDTGSNVTLMYISLLSARVSQHDDENVRQRRGKSPPQTIVGSSKKNLIYARANAFMNTYTTLGVDYCGPRTGLH